MARPVMGRVLMLLENAAFPEDPRVCREAQTLVGAGHQVVVICPAAAGQPLRQTIDGVRVYRYPKPADGNSFLGYLREYGCAMAATLALSLVVLVRHGFDVIHAANPPDTFVVIAALYKLIGKRFVYDHHDLAPEMYYARFAGHGNRLVYRLLVAFEQLSCRLADAVITTNGSYKQVEMERGQVPAERITIVRNGPDLVETAVEPIPGLRQPGMCLLGYVGVIGFQDGVDCLLRALHHLRYTLGRTDFRCVVVGRGDALPSIQALATRLGLDDQVVFTGWVNRADVPRYLRAFDICVAPEPSNHYNDRSTMIKIMEYMSQAKPIVAFDLPEHRVSAGDAAIYVPSNDEMAFAEALASLMDDPAGRQALGERGRGRVREALAWEHAAPQLIGAYATLLGGTARAAAPGGWRMSPAAIIRRTWRLGQWARRRNVAYIARRALALVRRYGLGPGKARRRVLDAVHFLGGFGCRPTFPTPGRVVERHSAFFRHLQALGAEFAVHGDDHVDFASLSHNEAREQLSRAAVAFRQAGLDFEGFRCPYLSCTNGVLASLPPGLFRYSSNQAIEWPVAAAQTMDSRTAIYDQLRRFYRAEASDQVVATPRMLDGLLEIPAALPDDLQLRDGLLLDQDGIRQAWLEMLDQIHRRGELFVVLFHPETFEQCQLAFASLLIEARSRQPAVWVATLRDISQWWWERSQFRIDVEPTGRCLRFDCTERATILLRNLPPTAADHPWDGAYRRLDGRELVLPPGVRPFVGLEACAPDHIQRFLREQGFVVDTGPQAAACGLYIDAATLAGLPSEVALCDYIEASTAALVRFWRWPDGAKSALCISGDLDAMSLADYAERLLVL